jgi:hypothetical protein
MTDFVYDRSFNTEGTSSVIKAAYYDSIDEELVVELHSGVLAGYQHVNSDVFTAMYYTNKSRIEGNEYSSVGNYWNVWVKPNFEGFDTTGIELIDGDEVQDEPVEERKLTGAEEAAEAATEDVFRLFTVHYTADFAEGDLQLSLFAKDADDALARFEKVAEAALWDDVEVNALTQHFG